MVSSYSAVVLADNPQGYWRLNETAGPTVADSSGHGMTGTYAGANNTYGVAGLITADTDKAVTLGSAGMLTIPDTTDLTAFSVEAWIKGQSSGTIIGRDATARMFFLWVNGGKAEMNVVKSGVFATVASASFINDNLRHHVVGTYDGTTTRVYLDGVESGTPSTAVSGALVTNDIPLTIGGRGTTAEATGTYDEVAYYTSALSAARVAAHFRAGIAWNAYTYSLNPASLPQPMTRATKFSVSQATPRPSTGQVWPRKI